MIDNDWRIPSFASVCNLLLISVRQSRRPFLGLFLDVFRQSKNPSKRHYQLQLGPYKQKHTTDKPSITKRDFTRHAGKAGGLLSSSYSRGLKSNPVRQTALVSWVERVSQESMFLFLALSVEEHWHWNVVTCFVYCYYCFFLLPFTCY